MPPMNSLKEAKWDYWGPIANDILKVPGSRQECVSRDDFRREAERQTRYPSANHALHFVLPPSTCNFSVAAA